MEDGGWRYAGHMRYRLKATKHRRQRRLGKQEAWSNLVQLCFLRCSSCAHRFVYFALY